MRVLLLAALLVTVGLAVADSAAAPGGYVRACASPAICAGPIGASINSAGCYAVLGYGVAGASALVWVCT